MHLSGSGVEGSLPINNAHVLVSVLVAIVLLGSPY